MKIDNIVLGDELLPPLPALQSAPPRHPLQPVYVEIETDQPEDGWWAWNIAFRKARCVDRQIVPLSENNAAEIAPITLYLSFAFDPIPDLHCFVFGGLIQGGGDTDPVAWEVDEEGRHTRFLVWHLCENLLQVEIERSDGLRRFLLVDRDSLIETFLKAYGEFGAKGGWGRHNDGMNSGPCPYWPIDFELASDA